MADLVYRNRPTVDPGLDWGLSDPKTPSQLISGERDSFFWGFRSSLLVSGWCHTDKTPEKHLIRRSPVLELY
jgi:hypothetical protein